MSVQDGGATTAREKPIRDPMGLWGWLRNFLVASIVVDLLVGASNGYELIAGTPDPADPQTIVLGLALLLVGVAAIVVFIGCAILTLRLTHRMMRNLHALESPEVSISPKWAAGWYFIPFANLVMPVRAVGEMWRGTFALAGEPGKSSVIGWWWAAWLISNFLGTGSFRLTMAAGGMDGISQPDPGLYMASIVTGLLSSLLGVVGALFMMRVFGPMARAQNEFGRASVFQ